MDGNAYIAPSTSFEETPSIWLSLFESNFALACNPLKIAISSLLYWSNTAFDTECSVGGFT